MGVFQPLGASLGIRSRRHCASSHSPIRRNVSALTVYTWSRCISVAEQSAVNNAYNSQDPFNVNTSRGDCAQDVRNNFSGSFVFTSSKFRSSIVQKIAGNWQLSPIVRLNSGLPSSLISGKDNALNGVTTLSGTGTQRPSQVCDAGQGLSQSIGQWFNTSCFVANGPGQLANSGRDTIRGPSTIVINVALSRRFTIREGQNLEFRAEAFNLPNLRNSASRVLLLTVHCSARSRARFQTASEPRGRPEIRGSCSLR